MYNDERTVFNKILQSSTKELFDRFQYEEKESGMYSITERSNPKHYVNFHKEKLGGIDGHHVNSDFDFVRPAGSNNYPELIKVAILFADIFDLPLDWKKNFR